MTRIMLVLMLHFFVVGHRGACQTLSKALLGHQMISQLVYEDIVEVFSSNLRREITREFSVRLVGIHEEVQHQHEPYQSHQKPL